VVPILIHIKFCQVCKYNLERFFVHTQVIVSCKPPPPEHREGTHFEHLTA
jgi:hypothetical protein